MKLKRELEGYSKNWLVSEIKMEIKTEMKIIIKNRSESEIGGHIPEDPWVLLSVLNAPVIK